MHGSQLKPKYCNVNGTTKLQEIPNEEGSVVLCKCEELLTGLQNVIEEVIYHYNKN